MRDAAIAIEAFRWRPLGGRTTGDTGEAVIRWSQPKYRVRLYLEPARKKSASPLSRGRFAGIMLASIVNRRRGVGRIWMPILARRTSREGILHEVCRTDHLPAVDAAAWLCYVEHARVAAACRTRHRRHRGKPMARRCRSRSASFRSRRANRILQSGTWNDSIPESSP